MTNDVRCRGVIPAEAGHIVKHQRYPGKQGLKGFPTFCSKNRVNNDYVFSKDFKKQIQLGGAMAKVVPFHGIFYNSKKVAHLKEVVAPPHDVISEREQQEYYERHPQNIIRLILGKRHPEDTEDNNRYTRAAGFFHDWLNRQILVQDAKPAFYVRETDYSLEGAIRSRLGFIGLVELEDFKKGGIFPHEKTFSATRADRLRLLQTCKANFSPVFSLFSDPAEEITGLLREGIRASEPDIDFELDGICQRLWRVTDKGLHREIAQRLAGTPLYIADGHHRYEAALDYRKQIASKRRRIAQDDPCNFVMMYLTSMNNPGLTILPVHRLLRDVPKEAIDSFAEKAKAYFSVKSLRSEGPNPARLRAEFLARIREGAGKGILGAVVSGQSAFHILQVKEGIMDRLFEAEIPAVLRNLDVTIATRLVIERIFAFDDAARDKEENILYTSRAMEAIDAVNTGRYALAIILNPIKCTDIERVSKAGLIMPRKSTYFYPKVLSGLVINKIEDY